MECKDLERLLHLYVDGTLDAFSASQVEEHLQACDLCSREVDYLKAISRMVEGYPLLEVPEGLADSVMAKIERREAVGFIVQEQEIIFKGAQMLGSGKIADFPRGLFTILYGSIRIMVRVYVHTVASALRETREGIYFSLTSLDLRRRRVWVS
jgi:hypothetical protein